MNQKALQNAAYLSDFPIMAMSFLLPLYCIELGFSPAKTTGLFAVLSLALFLTKLITGTICDKMSRKKVFCAGLLLKAVSYAVLAYSQSAVPLYLAQVIKGIAISLVSVSMYAMMSDDRQSNFAARQSKVSGASGRGELVGVLICCVLYRYTSFTGAWKYLLLIGAVLALYAAFTSAKALVEPKRELASLKIEFSKNVRRLFSVNVLFLISANLANAVLILYLSRRFDPKAELMSLVLFVPAILITYLSPAIGNAIARIGEKRSFTFGCLGTAVSLCVLPFLNSLALFSALWAAYNIFISFAGFAFDSVISLNADAQMRGRVSGAYMASSNLGSFIGSAAAGVLFQYVTPGAPFYVAAIFTAVALLAMIFILRRTDILLSALPE